MPTQKKPHNRLTADEKVMLKMLADRGWSARRIADFMKRARSTVAYHLKSKVQNPKRKPPEIARKIARIACKLAQIVTTKAGKKRPKFASANSIACEMARNYGIKRSRWSIQRHLRKSGFESRVRGYVPTTADFDHKKRHQFSKKGRRMNAKKCVFSDEKIYSTNEAGGRRMWVRKGKRPLPRERQRFPPKVMVFGAIGYNYFEWVILRNRATKDDREDERKLASMDGDVYRRRVLPKIVPYLVSKKLTFQQDGAKPHTAKKTLEYLNRKGVQLMENWPPRSPDLNPIETLWALTAKEVSDHNPQNLFELIQAVNAVLTHYKTNKMNVINKLVLSFNKRCEKCCAQQGAF